MKILIATGIYPPDIGGPATYSELLFNELPKMGIPVDVLSFGTVRRQPKLVRHLSYFFKALWHARSSDIIFAQDTVSVGLPALFASLLLGKIFIVRVPGDYAWEQSAQRYGVKDTIDEFQKKKYGGRIERLRSIQKFVLNHADHVIAPSRYFADIVRGWVKDPAKVKHIYNGVDVAVLAGDRTKNFTPRTIISSGRLVPWKGFSMLVSAMKQLPEWKLEIAGDGPDMENLKAIISKEGVSDRVKLLGRLDKSTLRKKIASSEVFALNTHYETFAFQIVEAMALGVPVIATNVSNLAEIIDDGKNGFLIQPDDTSAFVQTVKKIGGDSSLRARVVAAAAQRSSEFSIASTLDRVRDTFRAVAANETPAKKKKVFAAKLLRYLFSGGVAAVTDIGLLALFTETFHMWYLLSTIVAFLFAFMVSFSLQKFFTFQDHSTEGMHGQAAMYLVVTGTNLLINTGLVYVFVEYTGMHYVWAQIVTSIILAIESFVIYGMFIFKKKPKIAPQTS